MCAGIVLTACSDDDDSELRYDGYNGFVIDGNGFDRQVFDCSLGEVKVQRLQSVNVECPSDDATIDDCPLTLVTVGCSDATGNGLSAGITLYITGSLDTRSHPWTRGGVTDVLMRIDGGSYYSAVGVTSIVASAGRLTISIRGEMGVLDAPGKPVEVVGRFEVPR